MRTYHIDELGEREVERLAAYLEHAEHFSGMPGLYWLTVPPALLEDVQREHFEECGPYVMALEVLPDALRLELLVRARNRLRCECVSYACPALVGHMISYVDGLLKKIGIQHC